MCPDDDKASFEDISKHKFFNTNNLWVNLPKLKVRPPGCRHAAMVCCTYQCSRVTSTSEYSLRQVSRRRGSIFPEDRCLH